MPLSQPPVRPAVGRAARGARLLALLVAAMLVGGAPVAEARPTSTSSWIVKLRDGAAVDVAVGQLRSKLGVRADHSFRRAFRGYAARMTAAQAAALRSDPSVEVVVPDAPVELAADPQPAPPGIKRVGADPSAIRAIDGSDPELAVDIAIIDTGIAAHPDLRIEGGYNCTTADRSAWNDENTHGTHVAGAAAARDNGIGVVGVAPGARVWAIKVMDVNGGGLVSWLICGLDWVAAQRDPVDPSLPLFEVANMSLSVRAGDDGSCGETTTPSAYDLLHQAVCRLNRADVTNVVAAGNYREDAGNRVPAAYGEVITVGAICDSDGQPGGAGAACRSDSADDAWAGFSNYGPAVDIVAPGARILSTMPGGGYGYKDGTSLATPHVAGGAALYYMREALLGRPRPTPEQVRAGLIAAASTEWRRRTYPLGMAAAPPLLDVSALELPAGFGLGATPASRRAGTGESIFFDVWVGRYGGYTGAVDLHVSGLPDGATWATAQSPTIAAIDDGWQRLTVDLPASGQTGTYTVTISGSGEGGASAASTAALQFEGSYSVGALPRLNLLGGTVTGVPFRARVVWPAVSGAQRYQLQQSREDGPWQDVTLRRALTRKVNVSLWPGARYRFRYRVLKDSTWQPWQTSYGYVATPEMAHDGHAVLTGSWSTQSLRKAYSELSSYSTQAGAQLRFDFDGRSVAWLATKGPTRGRAAVYIDGRHVATVDLYARRVKHRKIVFRRSWAMPGQHRLEIVVLGTSGRPRVDVDAIVYISAD